jgi:DNA-directed RNA polymerase subunit RPC12/RpoP
MSPFGKKEKDTKKLIPTEELTVEEANSWQKEIRYRGAETLERTGRYKEAAGVYEQLASDFGDEKLFDKARELRNRTRSSQLEIVSVNVNKLISQVREGGLAVAYDCPTCGGKLSIDGSTKSESVKQCKYCGSSIETISLTDPIRKILSTLSS